jgi:hypothetical protein
MAETDTHHAGTGSDHEGEHGHPSSGAPLGPIDVAAWAYALVGSLLGVLVVLALYIASGS